MVNQVFESTSMLDQGFIFGNQPGNSRNTVPSAPPEVVDSPESPPLQDDTEGNQVNIFDQALYMAQLSQSFFEQHNTNAENISQVILQRLHYLDQTVASLQKQSTIYEQQISELQQNNAILANYKHQIFELQQKNIILETDFNQHSQYGRRECIEVSGVPTTITQDILEETMITMFQRMGVQNICSYDIVACHRIKKKLPNEQFPRVIIRFMNRKRAWECFALRKNLQQQTQYYYPDTYIHNSLCHRYTKIHQKCYQMKAEGEIEHFWIYNSEIYIKRTRNSQQEKILHISQLNNNNNNINPNT